MRKLISFLLCLSFLLVASVSFATTASQTPAPGVVPIAQSNGQLAAGWLPASGLSNNGVYYCAVEADLIAAIAASSHPFIQITGSFTLTANRTVPSTQTFWIPGDFAINRGGFTLTINGYFVRPGAYPVFLGTGSTVFGAGALDYTADPAWFPNGATDANSAAANVIAVLTQNSATPSVAALAGIHGTYQTNNSTSTTITNFTNGVPGQQFTLVANDAYTSIQLGAQITGLQGGSGAIALSQGDMVQVSYGGVSAAYCTGNGAPAACCTAAGVGAGCTGTNWHVVLVSAQGGSNLAYRNHFINPEMDIDQRNAGASQDISTSCTNSAPCYTVDRWYATATGADIFGSQSSAAAPWRHYYILTGATGNTGFTFGQRVESINVKDLTSSTVTLSVYIASSSLTSLTWTAYYPTGLDNYTSVIQIATGTLTVSNTLTRQSTQISLPANVALGVSIVFSGILASAVTLTITGAQLEPGVVATNFEHRPADMELIRCERYLVAWRGGTLSGNIVPGTGVASSTTVALWTFPFPATMRIPPTNVYFPNPPDFSIYITYGTVAKTVSAVGIFTFTSNQSSVLQVTTTGLTAGQWLTFVGSNSFDYFYFTGCEL